MLGPDCSRYRVHPLLASSSSSRSKSALLSWAARYKPRGPVSERPVSWSYPMYMFVPIPLSLRTKNFHDGFPSSSFHSAIAAPSMRIGLSARGHPESLASNFLYIITGSAVAVVRREKMNRGLLSEKDNLTLVLDLASSMPVTCSPISVCGSIPSPSKGIGRMFKRRPHVQPSS